MGILDVLKVNTAGVAVAVGSTARYAPFPSCGQPATNAGLSNPVGVAVDSGNIYVADNGNAPILRVNGTVSCLLQSKYFFSTGIVADDAGNVYFSVPQDHNVYEATASGQQVTLTGNQSAGCGGGAITDPEGLALDSTGNLFIADPGCNVIWQVNIASGSIAAVAGNANLGQGFSGDTGLAIDAQLSTPYGIAVDAASNLYIADTGNNRIREVVVGTGIINTIAGDGTSAVLQGPRGIAVAPGGTIYIADTGNQRIHPGAHPALGSYYQADATIGTSKPDRNLRMERGASWEHLQLQSQRSVGKHSLLEPSRLTRVRDGYQSSLRRKNDLRPVRDLRCKRPTAGPRSLHLQSLQDDLYERVPHYAATTGGLG